MVSNQHNNFTLPLLLALAAIHYAAMWATFTLDHDAPLWYILANEVAFITYVVIAKNLS